MRSTLLATLALPAFLTLGALAAIGGESLPAETPAPDQPAAAAADPAKAGGDEALRLPLGFKPKKRGKFVIYCRKDSVMGTRFPVETCYDEQGIRDYLQAQREDREKLDQLRRICSSKVACSAN